MTGLICWSPWHMDHSSIQSRRQWCSSTCSCSCHCYNRRYRHTLVKTAGQKLLFWKAAVRSLVLHLWVAPQSISLFELSCIDQEAEMCFQLFSISHQWTKSTQTSPLLRKTSVHCMNGWPVDGQAKANWALLYIMSHLRPPPQDIIPSREAVPRSRSKPQIFEMDESWFTQWLTVIRSRRHYQLHWIQKKMRERSVELARHR